MKTAYLVTRAMQWVRTAANVMRPRNATDRFIISTQGTSTTDDGTSVLQLDSGSSGSPALNVQRGFSLTDALIVRENASDLTCSTLMLTSAGGTLSNVGIYVKNNQLTFAHVCGANGVVRYLKITLDGVSCAWVQNATAP